MSASREPVFPDQQDHNDMTRKVVVLEHGSNCPCWRVDEVDEFVGCIMILPYWCKAARSARRVASRVFPRGSWPRLQSDLIREAHHTKPTIDRQPS